MTTCPICCYKFTDLIRKPIKCNICKKETCMKCIKYYLLNNLSEPHCLNCHELWNNEFLDNNMTRNFRKGEFKKHKNKILLGLEKSKIPETMIYIEREIRDRKIEKEHNMNSKYIEQSTKGRIITQKYEMRTGKIKGNDEYLLKCPLKDCRGFIKKSTCVICYSSICSRCNNIKNTKHKCNKDDIKTLELLKKDTKLCPNNNCSVPIHRIYGCFSKDTLIQLYPNKLIYSQDIKIGDKLVGDDGNSKLVIDIVSGYDKLYEIKQENGETYIVNSYHKLVLLKNNIIIEIILKDYLNNLENLEGLKIINNKIISTGIISVKELGYDKYYGWKVDGINKRFLLKDGTIVRNCNHMFCTKCNTAFNWDTGKIVKNTKGFSNPHYIDWAKKNNTYQENTDNNDLFYIIDTLKNKKLKTDFENIYNCYNSLKEINKYITAMESVDYELNLLVLRIRYILKDFNEDKWLKLISRTYKKKEGDNCLLELYRNYVIIIPCFFNNLVLCENNEDIEKIQTEINNYKEYFNECLKKVYNRFDYKPKLLNKVWKLENIDKKIR